VFFFPQQILSVSQPKNGDFILLFPTVNLTTFSTFGELFFAKNEYQTIEKKTQKQKQKLA
jgi:hypothetical protein